MMPSFAGRELRVSPATKLVFKLALHHASRAGRQTIEAADLFSAVFEETAGRAGVDPPPPRRRARGARLPAQRADARHRAARRAAEEALRAAAVPQALRHQPEPAGAAGQDAAGLRPRQGNPAGARDPLPPRARQLRDAHRRAGRRQDRHRRRAGAAHRVRAGNRAGPSARLPGGQPADEHDGRRHDAARHVRGSHPERHPRAQGAAEPDSVRRRGAHDGRRRLGARRAVGRRQRLQVGARPRRDPDGRGDDAQRVQGIHPGRRGAGAPLPLRSRVRADHRGDAAHSLQPAAASRAELLGPPPRRSDRDGARDVAALHAAPAPARQGHRLARHGVGARRDRSALGGEEGGRRRGHLARRADSRGHGLPRRHRSLQGHREPPAAARRRPEECGRARSPAGWC